MALQRYMGLFSSSAPLAAPMPTLPDEVVIRILSELTLKELITGLTVCKRFGFFSLANTLWSAFFLTRYGVAVIGPNIMEKFILHDACERKCKEVNKFDLASTEIADISKKDVFINQLCELEKSVGRLMSDDVNHPDRSWTTCLRGKLNVALARCKGMSGDEGKRHYRIGISWLYESERLANPLAMIHLAHLEKQSIAQLGNEGLLNLFNSYFSDQDMPETKELKRLNAAHSLGCLEATFELAANYWGQLQCDLHFNRRNRYSDSLRRFGELLFQAARGGHVQSAITIGMNYAMPYENHDTLPLGEMEWDFLYFQEEMQNKFNSGLYTTADLVEVDLAKLKSFIESGVWMAARMLSHILLKFHQCGIMSWNASIKRLPRTYFLQPYLLG